MSRTEVTCHCGNHLWDVVITNGLWLSLMGCGYHKWKRMMLQLFAFRKFDSFVDEYFSSILQVFIRIRTSSSILRNDYHPLMAHDERNLYEL
jgi:hypothetical protein